MRDKYADFYSKLGERIRTEREAIDWTQGHLSRESCVTQPRISEIESGKRALQLTTAVRIADALGVPLDWLAKGD